MRLTFADFAANPETGRTAWIKEPGIAIYVRRSIPGIAHGDFELANLNAKRPGSGALTRFLDTYEPQYRFYVECILEPRLVPFLARRGYTIVTVGGFAPSMLGPERL